MSCATTCGGVVSTMGAGNRSGEARGDAQALLSRRQVLARMGATGVAVGLGGAVLGACDTPPPEPGATNILLIVADDMRYDHLRFMPNVKRLISDEGTRFTQARCNVALCQPSRVGLVTGQMSKHNGEIRIGFTETALEDHDNCLGKWVHDAGYRCGFFGKYINWIDSWGGIDAPAGYSTWRELTKETSAYEFTVRRNKDRVTIKGTYSTDYLAAQAHAFIAGGGPFMCVVTPTQPHTPFRPRRDWRRPCPAPGPGS